LGFNSDVFEGLYDDNKYVDAMKKKYNNPKESPAVKQKLSDISKVILMKAAEELLKHPDLPSGYMIELKKLELAVLNEFGKLPTKESSIAKIVAEINIEDVMVENSFVKGLE